MAQFKYDFTAINASSLPRIITEDVEGMLDDAPQAIAKMFCGQSIEAIVNEIKAYATYMANVFHDARIWMQNSSLDIPERLQRASRTSGAEEMGNIFSMFTKFAVHLKELRQDSIHAIIWNFDALFESDLAYFVIPPTCNKSASQVHKAFVALIDHYFERVAAREKEATIMISSDEEEEGSRTTGNKRPFSEI